MPPRITFATGASTVQKNLRSWVRKNVYRQGRKRVNIISPRLCDDIIRRLSPSLPAKHTCDIIDLNPGVCLWSTKLHNHLKPRRHFLIEPDRELYEPFIEPLLSSPDSTYRHAASIDEVFTSEGALLRMTQTASGLDVPTNVNKSILFIANLTASAEVSKKGGTNYAGSIGKHMLHTLYNAMLHRPEENMHKYGLVRMLAWLPDQDKSSVIPRTVISRPKQAVQWDMAANLSEVAGGDSYQQGVIWNHRQFELDLESQHSVTAKAGPNISIKIPGRCPPPPEPSPASLELNAAGLAALRDSPYRPTFIDELVDLEEQYTNGTIADNSKQAQRLTFLRNKGRAIQNLHRRGTKIAQTQRDLDREEKQLFMLSCSDTEKAEKLKSNIAAATALKKERDSLVRHLRITVDKYIDDQRAFDHDPPVLAWDRREAEPLWAKKDEFWPPKTLALIDFQPEQSFITQLDTKEKRLCFNEIVSTLLQHPGSTVRDVLQKLAHDGLEQFLERVPQLRDPLQGGKPDLDDLRIRSLPVQLFVDIALAWANWPFRPESSDVNWLRDQLSNKTFSKD